MAQDQGVGASVGAVDGPGHRAIGIGGQPVDDPVDARARRRRQILPGPTAEVAQERCRSWRISMRRACTSCRSAWERRVMVSVRRARSQSMVVEGSGTAGVAGAPGAPGAAEVAEVAEVAGAAGDVEGA
ncbi:hypothetical protein ACFSSF_00630 [Dietzia aerolata]|uniref:hypothetical protein n=1 Tax=Dietzia aerolata TaxID=595984 RepID=UPI003634D565